ncbi:MAG: 50S ribosomal protein L33 [Gammaproteobacteria bacterium RIFCSPHIGHO2_12_FULL_41_15]|nr:MAG: 50S ribosomal protein L33 [Gammaproteobacteria bacterium RIFCSPHIGHO2_12_FULL_41_15]
MAKKKIDNKIKLVSTGKRENGSETRYTYTTVRNKRNLQETGKNKLEAKKYDPQAFNSETGKCGMHVLFKEEKI